MTASNLEETGGFDEARSSSGKWRKSSFSESNGDCIEVAILTKGQISVRDSKAIVGPHLSYSSHAWTAFVGDVRHALAAAGRKPVS